MSCVTNCYYERLRVSPQGDDSLRQQGAASYLKTLCRKVTSFMSVPAPREPLHGGRWETIRYALETNPRTFRLCLILSVAAVPPCLAAVVAELVRHMLLYGQGWESTRRLAAELERLGYRVDPSWLI